MAGVCCKCKANLRATNRSYCKDCWCLYVKEYREAGRDLVNARQQNYNKMRRYRNSPMFRAKIIMICRRSSTKRKVELWSKVLGAYGASCACCGEKEVAFLTLDHIDGGGGEHRRKRTGPTAVLLDVVRSGFPKDRYRVLCMNCNWATRYGKPCPHSEASSAVANGY